MNNNIFQDVMIFSIYFIVFLLEEHMGHSLGMKIAGMVSFVMIIVILWDCIELLRKKVNSKNE